MRKPIIAANWKMFMTKEETTAYWTAFNLEVDDTPHSEIVIAAPFTSLSKLSELTENTQKISLAGQNFYPEKSGAFTGEISAEMLRELYVRYVIIGHSERRQYFAEDDAFINKKVLFALASELRPILCVGESLTERDAGQENAVLEKQLRGGLAGVSPKQFEDIVIAYEPVWAIGTGRTATPEQAQAAHAHIRKILADLIDKETAAKIRIQYGGSVKPANAKELLSQADIDGALVGGASLDPRSFAEIINAADRD
ncbi:MAG: triose-phosphate isomerase [Chthoniobacterales bacterium]